MSLKNKINIIGVIAIMLYGALFVLLVFSIFYDQYVQIGVFTLTTLYYEMKLKYRELREKEIEEILRNK